MSERTRITSPQVDTNTVAIWELGRRLDEIEKGVESRLGEIEHGRRIYIGDRSLETVLVLLQERLESIETKQHNQEQRQRDTLTSVRNWVLGLTTILIVGMFGVLWRASVAIEHAKSPPAYQQQVK